MSDQQKRNPFSGLRDTAYETIGGTIDQDTGRAQRGSGVLGAGRDAGYGVLGGKVEDPGTAKSKEKAAAKPERRATATGTFTAQYRGDKPTKVQDPEYNKAYDVSRSSFGSNRTDSIAQLYYLGNCAEVSKVPVKGEPEDWRGPLVELKPGESTDSDDNRLSYEFQGVKFVPAEK